MASLYPLKWNQRVKKTFRTIFDPWKKENKLKKNTPPPPKKNNNIYVSYISQTYSTDFCSTQVFCPPNPAASAKGQRFTWKPRPWAVWIKSRQKARLVNSLAKTCGVWICWWIFLIERSFLKPSIYLLMRVVTINSGLICKCIYIIHIMRKIMSRYTMSMSMCLL